jgi:proline racemase/trans-L-3-hydroxyproline dehydratase
MKFKKSLHAIDSHTMGEPTRIITSGLPKIPGKTMSEKKEYLEKNYDYIRTAVMHEPRGHKDMFGSILVQPIADEADYGIIFMDGGGYLNMCGHGSLGAATTIVETGMVEVVEPYTKVVLESPAGIIDARVLVKDEKVKEVTITNVPSFLYKENLEIEIPELGKMKVDIAFGGSFFALVSAEQLDLDIIPANSSKISEIGMKIRDEVNKSIIIAHPLLSHIKTVDLVEIYGPPKTEGATLQNVVVFGSGQVDRSPCGTGTSAKLAALYAKGKLGMNEEFVYESITGTSFKGSVVGETMVGDFKAIIPQITGKAFITGFNHFIIDDEDPLKYGFVLK